MTDDLFPNVRKRQCRFLYCECGYKSYGIICYWILQIKTKENNLWTRNLKKEHMFSSNKQLWWSSTSLYLRYRTTLHILTLIRWVLPFISVTQCDEGTNLYVPVATWDSGEISAGSADIRAGWALHTFTRGWRAGWVGGVWKEG